MVQRDAQRRNDLIHTPENHGVTYEELQTITRNRHSATVIGEYDIM